MITMQNWRVIVPDTDRMIGFENDHLTACLGIAIDAPPGWSFKLDVEARYRKNIIDLAREGDRLSVTLTRSMLAVDGMYRCQLRGVNGEQVRHTNTFNLYVGDSVGATEAFPEPLPSEFEQMEQRVSKQAEIAARPPQIGQNGNWMVWSDGTYADSGIVARGETPEIQNGFWWIGGVNTGVPASGGSAVERITNTELEELLK